MTIALEDVLEANIVLAGARLLQEPHQRDQFARRVGADVEIASMPADAPSALSGLAPANILPTADLAVLLQKERVSVQVSSNTTVRQHYARYDGLERLANIAYLAIECSEAIEFPLQAYGCNINAVFTQDEHNSSQAFIAASLFSSKLATLDNWPLTGGGAQLVYQSGSHTLTFRVEPRVNDVLGQRVFLNLNQHVDAEFMPSKELIWTNLQLAWRSTEYLAENLSTQNTL